MAKFPDRLWSLRTAACMTQQELADTINTSRRAVIKWESGKAQPTKNASAKNTPTSACLLWMI